MSDSSDGDWRRDRVRLTLPNDMAHLGVARAAVRALAQPYGYSAEELDSWDAVVEEAVTNLVRFAYDFEERASFDIDCLLGGSGLTVRFVDHGRPFDPRDIQPARAGTALATVAARSLEWHLTRRLMDVATVESLGRDGTRLTLFKAAPHGFDPVRLPALEALPKEPHADATAIICRKATADDAFDIVRLFYDCYRYTYFNELVYSPEGLSRMISKGEIDSFVEHLPCGRLVAHMALIHYADRPSAIEAGMGVAEPAYRGGHHLLEKSAKLAAEEIRRTGKKVVFAGSVTTHVAAQKLALHSGLRECGLMLGAVPPEDFTAIETKERGRGTILFLSALCADRPLQALVLPPAHEAFISGLYAQCGIPFARGEAATAALGDSNIALSIRPKVGAVRAVVLRIGSDLVDRIKTMMHGARKSRAAVGQLFLPLTDPALPQAVTALEPLGWFVTGMLPEGGMAGDVLLMHWLNGWAMDYDAPALARREGRQLLDEVRARDPELR